MIMKKNIHLAAFNEYDILSAFVNLFYSIYMAKKISIDIFN